MGKAPVRAIVADSDAQVRQALKLVCEESLSIMVVAEAVESRELICLIETYHPHLLLLDWQLPDMHPALLMNILQRHRPISVVVTGSHREMRAEALKAGASGFVYKGDPPDELLTLLRALIDAQ